MFRNLSVFLVHFVFGVPEIFSIIMKTERTFFGIFTTLGPCGIFYKEVFF